MCVLSFYPWLPVPRGGISSLHFFEGFLIWGLEQPRSSMPSSIIPVEEQREGEEGVEKRRKSKGDGVISYLSLHSSARPISSNRLSPSLSPLLFLSCLLISPFLLVSPAFRVPACSASHPYSMSIRPFICLSDCLTPAPTVVPFVSANKWGWPFIVKQTPTGSDETTGV